ncbi:hypothetical protein J7J69_06470 [candidate division WOR-3 bacterium]|nr:hypothetical protein [candidate division WOR-3 bacterium]
MSAVLDTEKNIKVSIIGGRTFEGRITGWDEKHNGFILEVENIDGVVEKIFITLHSVTTITTVKKAPGAIDRG